MVRCVWLRGSEDLSQALFVRESVFVREQGFSLEIEHDEYDEKSLHLLVFEDDAPVATGRLLMKDDTLMLGRIAVLSEKRGQGFGDLVMRVLLDMGLRMGAPEMAVDAQVRVLPFYEKYGFTDTGDRFDEEGVPHARMRVTSGALQPILYAGCGGGCATCGGCGGACGGDCGHDHDHENCGHDHDHGNCAHDHDHENCGHDDADFDLYENSVDVTPRI